MFSPYKTNLQLKIAAIVSTYLKGVGGKLARDGKGAAGEHPHKFSSVSALSLLLGDHEVAFVTYVVYLV